MMKFRVWDKSEKKFFHKGISIDIETGDVIDDCGIINKDRVIVHQFTGLKDKNGNNIFEGDILRNSMGDVSVVEQNMEMNCGCCGYIYGWEFPESLSENCEIIGNVCENEEIIEKQ